MMKGVGQGVDLVQDQGQAQEAVAEVGAEAGLGLAAGASAEVEAEVGQGLCHEAGVAAEVEVGVSVVEVAAEVKVEVEVVAEVPPGRNLDHVAEVEVGGDLQAGHDQGQNLNLGQGLVALAEVAVEVRLKVEVRQKTEARKMRKRSLDLQVIQIVTEMGKRNPSVFWAVQELFFSDCSRICSNQMYISYFHEVVCF